ncbi:DUF3088 domain-containing protein [Inquilinus limosus]|uniref:DUF3088 domain-containing protein n=1 Tax=Inquilinus limosus TaxID=171674 RepID=A0A211ZV07_9PROT|nr:DUF3088 domain-containing protein [Inquilinus limosus]OWJ69110.1 hypothetical protein BWR60_00805 [Inquilinus limosus]
MSRDRIFLIEPGFEDPKRPGERFVCPHCNAIEGLLAAFPDLAARLDVQRVPFPRPRLPVIAAVGEANQALPVLVLGDEAPPPADAAVYEGARFVVGSGRIIELLAERHGFPRLHS